MQIKTTLRLHLTLVRTQMITNCMLSWEEEHVALMYVSLSPFLEYVMPCFIRTPFDKCMSVCLEIFR
jgi:hypothetical protein